MQIFYRAKKDGTSPRLEHLRALLRQRQAADTTTQGRFSSVGSILGTIRRRKYRRKQAAGKRAGHCTYWRQYDGFLRLPNTACGCHSRPMPPNRKLDCSLPLFLGYLLAQLPRSRHSASTGMRGQPPRYFFISLGFDPFLLLRTNSIICLCPIHYPSNSLCFSQGCGCAASTMKPLFNAPELVILVFQSCGKVEDGLSLASTCKFLASIWRTHAAAILYPLIKAKTAGFNQALLAVG